MQADTLSLATWHANLSRKGPGLLLRDILRNEVSSALEEIVAADVDVLVLTDFDYDQGGAALDALAEALAAAGVDYPHRFARRPNTGWPTGRDLDGDGRLGGPRDAQGYGQFSGQGGIAILSRLSLRLERSFTELLWSDLPGNRRVPGDPAADIQRLSSSAHWAVRLDTGRRPLTLLTWHATPPVFDGPEDRNGRRNADELALWLRYLDGAFGPPPETPVLIGNANLDPMRGDGLREAMQEALGSGRLQDPLPGTATVEWAQTGPMRVSYILPASDLALRGAVVRPPVAGTFHRLVKVTLDLP